MNNEQIDEYDSESEESQSQCMHYISAGYFRVTVCLTDSDCEYDNSSNKPNDCNNEIAHKTYV